MPEKKSRPVLVLVQRFLGKKPDRTGLSSTRSLFCPTVDLRLMLPSVYMVIQAQGLECSLLLSMSGRAIIVLTFLLRFISPVLVFGTEHR